MSVIFSRAPLRISLGGGGTDLPSYYREHGGFLVVRSDRQVRVHAHPHRLPAPLPDEVLRARGGRRGRARSATRSCARRCCATGAATRWRSPRWPTSRPGPAWARRAPIRVCLLKGLAQARQHVDHPGRAGRGGVRDRDRRARRAGRQAGPVRRRPRRHLRLHLQSRRQRGGGAARARARACCGACATSCCCSTPARRARPPRCWPTRTSAPRRATSEMLENLHRPRSSAGAAATCLREGDLDALRGTDARALGKQAPALARHDRRTHRSPVHARPAQRRASAASSSARAAAAFCWCTPDSPRTRARRWPPRALSSSPSNSSSAAHTRASTHERPAGCGRRLRPDRRQARERADRAGRAAGLPRRQRAGHGRARRTLATASRARSVQQLLDLSPDVVVVATLHDQLARSRPSAALAAGAHVLVEKPAGLSAAQVDQADRLRARQRAHGQGRLQPSLPPRHRARGRGGPLGQARRAHAPARPLRPRGPPGLRPRVARRFRSARAAAS